MRRIGQYELLDRVGTGGMGEVWRARDRSGRIVALKKVHDNLVRHQVIRDRAGIELDALIQLQEHPNIVTVLDSMTTPLAIVTEFIEGASLDTILQQESALPVDFLLPHFHSIVSAIAFAHRNGIIHRDIKPGNVMLANQRGRDGRVEQVVKVLDFGLARIGTGVALTKLGDPMGTPQFMSPEQHKGEEADHRTDIYALGALLFTCSTGRVPFPPDRYPTDHRIAMGHIADGFPMPTSLRPGLPRWVDEVVRKATAKRPADRYASCDEMLKVIERHLPKQAGRTKNQPKPAKNDHAAIRRNAEAALQRAGHRAVHGQVILIPLTAALNDVMNQLEAQHATRGDADGQLQVVQAQLETWKMVGVVGIVAFVGTLIAWIASQ